MAKRFRVLHVLPHPGGGGERYVDLLGGLEHFEAEKIFLGRDHVPRFGVITAALRAQTASRPFDLLHVHGEVAAGLCLPTLALRPSVVTINGLHLVRRLAGWKRAAAAVNLRLVVRSASATICVSESELADVLAEVGDSSRLALVRDRKS